MSLFHFLHRWSPWGEVAQAQSGGLFQARYCLTCRLAQKRKIA